MVHKNLLWKFTGAKLSNFLPHKPCSQKSLTQNIPSASAPGLIIDLFFKITS